MSGQLLVNGWNSCLFLSAGWCVVTALQRCDEIRANVHTLKSDIRRIRLTEWLHARIQQSHCLSLEAWPSHWPALWSQTSCLSFMSCICLTYKRMLTFSQQILLGTYCMHSIVPDLEINGWKRQTKLPTLMEFSSYLGLLWYLNKIVPVKGLGIGLFLKLWNNYYGKVINWPIYLGLSLF